jgi:outer membrane protein OmpA-like peptidoglycan-associated protein
MGTVARLRATAVLLAAVLLLGCQTTPTATEIKARKVAALEKLGFVPTGAGWDLNLGVKLLFELNNDQVSESGRIELDRVARTLAQVGVDRIRVEGHTDNAGPPRYNQPLSLRRAESVAQLLVAGGWQDSAIERRGYGADKPVADNATAEGRAQNRRVVVTVQVE